MESSTFESEQKVVSLCDFRERATQQYKTEQRALAAILARRAALLLSELDAEDQKMAVVLEDCATLLSPASDYVSNLIEEL